MLKWMKSLWSSQSEPHKVVIAGLGNPGTKYANTRHNMGFLVVQRLAERQGLQFSRRSQFEAAVAEGDIEGKKVVLLLPMGYMNNSGRSIAACMRFFKVPMSQFLVVVDDVALPFGDIRLRAKGSCGGHNGLRSVEHYLKTQDYFRLRVGIDSCEQGMLADYVLSEFTKEEKRALTLILDKGAEALEAWLKENR